MKNILVFPDVRRRREQACHWLVSIEEGLSQAEKAELQTWLRADPSHPRILLAQARLWDDLDILSELSGLYPLENYRSPAPVSRRRIIAAAAGVALALAGGWQMTAHLSTPADSLTTTRQPPAVSAAVEGASALREYATSVGEQLSVRLSDGSVVSLNTDTRLFVRFSADERLVSLERGEALFDVAHDPARAFRVDAGERLFEALGTVFNVQRAASGGLELIVTEGRVRVRRTRPDDPGIAGPSVRKMQGQQEITVAAGQSAAIADIAENVRNLAAADVDARLAWKRGMLVFRGEPLARALNEVERYTTVRFVLKDEALASVPVGGYFRTGDVEGVLLALRETFGIETRQVSGTEVELSLR